MTGPYTDIQNALLALTAVVACVAAAVSVNTAVRRHWPRHVVRTRVNRAWWLSLGILLAATICRQVGI